MSPARSTAQVPLAHPLGRLAIAIRACLVLPLGLFPPAHASAATYYVDQNHPNASDSNPGTTEAAPWRTLVRAMSVEAGDTAYVKGGTYIDSNSTTQGHPSLRPLNSGRPDARITFRVYPGHRVTLGAAIAAGSHNDYITWDGFTLAPGSFVWIYGSPSNRVVGTAITNCTSARGPTSLTQGNYDAVFLQHTSHTVIRNCILENTYATHHGFRASGIKLYFSDHVLVENNEFRGVDDAIFDKAGGQFNVFRRNYIHDIYHTAIVIACFGHAHSPCIGSQISNNIISNAGKTGLAIGNTVVPTVHFENFSVYNNTIYKVPVGISTGTAPGLRLWNNIISDTTVALSLGHSPADVALSDFSTFYPATIFLSQRTRYMGLRDWQRRTGFDIHSIRQNPLFVNPLGADFRLHALSPARGAGRVGGMTSGETIDMGAFAGGVERIGPCPTECE